MDETISKFYMGHLPMKTKFHTNVGCDVSLKWSRVILNVVGLAFHYRIPHYKLVMLSPNVLTSSTKFERVIVRWIALLIMEDGGCSLTFVNTTNQMSSRWQLKHHV